ncbi:MAG: SMC-Scp complex subunit ScpB [Duodenibacillus sp.]|nr:SMC-Scp complex subunit ScpB [Duodenibacillus sp.]
MEDNANQTALILEAALLAQGRPMGMGDFERLFEGRRSRAEIRAALSALERFWEGRALRLAMTAQGWRFQTAPAARPFLARLQDDKPARYSRAAMETLAVIAYRQPATRGDIEEVRGVSVNPQIIRQLEERGWIEVVGRRQVPGRPELFATTRQFLDDLGLRALSDLPAYEGQGEPEQFELGIAEPQAGASAPESAAATDATMDTTNDTTERTSADDHD